MSDVFCCIHAWRAYRDAAWKARDLHCGCDHNESCDKCYPPDFRPGGFWDKVCPENAAPPSTQERTEDPATATEPRGSRRDESDAARAVQGSTPSTEGAEG